MKLGLCSVRSCDPLFIAVISFREKRVTFQRAVRRSLSCSRGGNVVTLLLTTYEPSLLLSPLLLVRLLRFINARRRIVQPMIDQSNRAGKFLTRDTTQSIFTEDGSVLMWIDSFLQFASITTGQESERTSKWRPACHKSSGSGWTHVPKVNMRSGPNLSRYIQMLDLLK